MIPLRNRPADLGQRGAKRRPSGAQRESGRSAGTLRGGRRNARAASAPPGKHLNRAHLWPAPLTGQAAREGRKWALVCMDFAPGPHSRPARSNQANVRPGAQRQVAATLRPPAGQLIKRTPSSPFQLTVSSRRWTDAGQALDRRHSAGQLSASVLQWGDSTLHLPLGRRAKGACEPICTCPLRWTRHCPAGSLPAGLGGAWSSAASHKVTSSRSQSAVQSRESKVGGRRRELQARDWAQSAPAGHFAEAQVQPVLCLCLCLLCCVGR